MTLWIHRIEYKPADAQPSWMVWRKLPHPDHGTIEIVGLRTRGPGLTGATTGGQRLFISSSLGGGNFLSHFQAWTDKSPASPVTYDHGSPNPTVFETSGSPLGAYGSARVPLYFGYVNGTTVPLTASVYVDLLLRKI